MSGDKNCIHLNCIIAVTEEEKHVEESACRGVVLYVPSLPEWAGAFIQWADEYACMDENAMCIACIGLPRVLGIYRCTLEYNFISGHNPSMFGEPADDSEPSYWYTVTDAVLVMEYEKKKRKPMNRCYACGGFLSRNAFVCNRCGDYFPPGEDI